MSGSPVPATGVGWDATIPDDSQPHGRDFNEHRETKLAVGIRMAKEHVAFATSSAGGEHKAGSAVIYCGDYSSAAAGDDLPTTKPDEVTALDSNDAGRIAYDTDAVFGGLFYKYSGSAWEQIPVVALTGAQTIAGVKTFSSIPKIPTTAPTAEAEVAGKKYVDDQIAAINPIGDGPTTNDSESNAMLKSHAYKAQTAGFVNTYSDSYPNAVALYVGATNNPAGAGALLGKSNIGEGGNLDSATALVPKDYYFEVTCGGTPTIYWTPLISGGGNPIDQD